MNFWTDHSVMFIIGIIVMPRMMLIYLGMIQPLQIPPILGMIFCPRIFMVGILTPIYSDQNQVLVVVMWLIAVVFDVVGFIVKANWGFQMQKAAMEQLQRQSRGF